jgi:transcriptional regulator with XRE-family HTH domain
MTIGDLVRETRTRHRLSQSALARRARTTPRQVARIERGEISPTVATVDRLMTAMGERLDVAAVPLAHGTQSDDDLREALSLSPAERLRQAATLSRTLTGIAALVGSRPVAGERGESSGP